MSKCHLGIDRQMDSQIDYQPVVEPVVGKRMTQMMNHHLGQLPAPRASLLLFASSTLMICACLAQTDAKLAYAVWMMHSMYILCSVE